jgi:hypothetical protein
LHYCRNGQSTRAGKSPQSSFPGLRARRAPIRLRHGLRHLDCVFRQWSRDESHKLRSLNSLSLSGSLSLATVKTSVFRLLRFILPSTLARAKYAPLELCASVAQLAEQLTLNFRRISSLVFFRDLS